MFQVSPAYINAALGVGVKKRRIVGSIGTASSVIASFTENDIFKDSLSYSSQCVSGADINLGGVFVSTLKLTFLPSVSSQIASGAWANKIIKISIGLEVAPDEWDDIPLQDFWVSEATKSALGMEVTCYDYMSHFDKRTNFSTSTGRMYAFLSQACEKCGVEMAQTESQLFDFPNGRTAFTMSPENDISTWRDVVSWCALTLGGYAVINRENKLEIRAWHLTPDITLDINGRFMGGSWSDFITKYTGVSYVSIEDEMYHRYSVAPDNGLTMKLGQNPFFQTGGITTVRTYCMDILESLQDFRYTPFKCQTLADIFIDLGDVIQFTEGISSTCIGCVMKIDFSFANGATFEGYGKNPALFDAQSKTDKNMSGLMNRSASQEMVFLKDTNIEAIEQIVENGIENESIHLGQIFLNATKETNVEINSRVIYNAMLFAESQDSHERTNMSLRYVLDGETIKVVPFDQTYVTNSAYWWTADIDHTIVDYQTILDVAAGLRQVLDVWLDVDAPASDWTLNIPVEGIEVVVKGQGLSKEEEWSGLIIADDRTRKLSIASNGGIKELTDAVSIEFRLAVEISVEDEMDKTEIGSVGSAEISETQIRIFLTSITSNLVSADHEDNIVAANGDNIVVKG